MSRGAKGELVISGPTLSRGYINQSALTDEKFLANGQIDGAGRCTAPETSSRLNVEGELEFFGRIDTQVKIRGYRVELSEIESVLRDDPQVRAAAVQLVERDGLQQLAAYVVAEQAPAQLGRDQILTLLESRMPPYMIPGYLDVLRSCRGRRAERLTGTSSRHRKTPWCATPARVSRRRPSSNARSSASGRRSST